MKTGLQPSSEDRQFLSNIFIRPCTSLGDIREFVETNHYSKSVLGVTPFLSFEIFQKDDMQRQIGAAVFGIPGQVQTELKYGEFSGNSKQTSRPKYVCVELRRFVLLDEAPVNSESFVLSKILRSLQYLGVDRIISYADPNQTRAEHPDGAHTGLIYRASGFHKIKENPETSAYIMQADFTEEGKTFKKGRRLPIRNRDQYQNFRIKCDMDTARSEKKVIELFHEKYPKEAVAWEEARREGKAVFWQDRAQGKVVFVIKKEKYLTSLSKRLRNAESLGYAVLEDEKGKILYIKDLTSGMPYFQTPNPLKGKFDDRTDKCCLCCAREEADEGLDQGKTTKTQKE
jgi:hypothetical protein